MSVDQIEAAIEVAPLAALAELSQAIWREVSTGSLSEDDASRLAETIHQRRQAHRGETPSAIATGAPGSPSARPARAWSYFPPKRPQRSPDKTRSLERRRTLAASAPLPPSLACKFTVGELATLRIIADEVREKGACVLTIPEIASRAGVGVTKARMALRIAASLGLIVVTERRVPYRPNLSNVVRIVSREWVAWIARAKPKPRPPIAPTGVPTDDPIPASIQGEPSQKRRPRNQRFTDRVNGPQVPLNLESSHPIGPVSLTRSTY